MGVVTSGGAGSGGVRIEVDPDTLIRAGQRMGSLGAQLGMLSDALGAALASGIASGMDPAGANFGFSYGRNAQDFADQLANAANNFKSVGYMLEATGYNYKNADAASTVGGAGPMGGVGGEPAETKAADVPTGPNSMMVPPPLKWSLIQPFLRAIPGIGMFASAAMTWPSGNPSLLRVTAAQWRNLAIGLSAFDDDIAALKTAVSVQKIPEGAKIDEALTTLAGGMSKLAEVAPAMAQSIDDFANGVHSAQDAIRRLLDRLSFEGLWDTVTGLLTGEGDDILREVARDVGDVLENFQQQVKGVVGLLGELATAIGDAATAFQKWVRPVLVEAFGEDVGGTLADAVTVYTDFQVGLTTGLINTVSGTVATADPDTWKGMAEVAMSVAEDPSKLPGVLENMGKEFVAWDQWSGDHPGRAAGEAAFNIGSLFVPGGALSKTGTVAKGLGYTTRLLEEGRFPRLGDLPGFGSSPRNVEGLDDLPGIGGGRPPEIPEVKPGAIPEQVISPVAPNGLDAPSIPHSPEVPAGPPDPPGPTGTPGGDNHHAAATGGGPPPGPPGRSVGPAESGPGRVDAPSPQSTGPSPVDSQQLSDSAAPTQAPSIGDHTPPATQHAPETSSPAGAHESGPAQSDNGQTSASHEPRTPEATGNGHATEQQRGGLDPREDPGSRHADTNGAPAESHQGSEGYSGGPEGPTHAPADHQPAHMPAADQPSGHEGQATDATPTREQPQTVSSGEGQHQPVGTTSGVMAGGAAPVGPMAFHASGPAHAMADGPASAGKTSTPEVSARGTDAKVPQAGPPESPRAQAHASPGPATENTPSAPVKPAAGQHAAGSADQPVHPGPERGGNPSPQRDSSSGRTDGLISHVQSRSDGLGVDRGVVPRGVREPSESGSVAGKGHDAGLPSEHSHQTGGGAYDPNHSAASAGQHPDRHPEPPEGDGTTRDGSSHEPHAPDAASHDQHPGSAWDGPAGDHAAQLLPADDSGYRIQPRDCEYLGISPEQVEAWANREAPLGMTPTEFRDFSNSLYDALAREGFTPEDLDIRLQGSSARFFSGEHKALPLDSDLVDNPQAQARMATWFGDDENRPLRRPFDSMHRLGLDDEPSDYDIQISSDAMVEACRQRWAADGSKGELVHRKYGFVAKRIFKDAFPALWQWASEWTINTGRPVAPALFSSSGPPDTSAEKVSSHFRDSDWCIFPERSFPR